MTISLLVAKGFAILIVCGAALLGCSASPEGPTLEEARAKCFDPGEVKDGGTSLVMYQRGGEGIAASPAEDMGCVLRELEMPESYFDELRRNADSPGAQEVEWDGYQASFGYAEDTGLSVIVRVDED